MAGNLGGLAGAVEALALNAPESRRSRRHPDSEIEETVREYLDTLALIGGLAPVIPEQRPRGSAGTADEHADALGTLQRSAAAIEGLRVAWPRPRSGRAGMLDLVGGSTS